MTKITHGFQFASAEEALCWATECQMATVEGLQMRSRPPKGELARATSIQEILVQACQIQAKEEAVRTTNGGRTAVYLRLKARLEAGALAAEWVDFGDVARDRLSCQAQYVSRYIDGLLGYEVCGQGLRFQKEGGGPVDTTDYHFIQIHKDDIEEFVRRVDQARRRAR